MPEALDDDEITWKQLRIEHEHVLGSEHFARIFKGYIVRESSHTGGEAETNEMPVAVKIPKEFNERSMFEQEIELMRQIGK